MCVPRWSSRLRRTLRFRYLLTGTLRALSGWAEAFTVWEGLLGTIFQLRRRIADPKQVAQDSLHSYAPIAAGCVYSFSHRSLGELAIGPGWVNDEQAVSDEVDVDVDDG